MKNLFSSVKRVHFVGIGGIGMSGIAEILLKQGFVVSGSDLNKSDNTDFLENLGATIFIGHSRENINGAEVVVYSSAVDKNTNLETLAAARLKIPIIRRAEMLAEVSRLNHCLAISGTHGKTTTTSMLGLVLIKVGMDPTVIVGGRLGDFGGTNARLGNGDWTVVEADEYDRSFLQLLPTVAVINNIEPEHLDIYHDFDDLKNTFTEFANKVPFYGFVAVGLDNPGVEDILSCINKKTVTFGLNQHCDFYPENFFFEQSKSSFDVFRDSKFLGNIKINVPGIHNIKNALGCISVAINLGIDFEIVRQALAEFSGVYRRFDIKGEVDGILIVDDYAHHPTEVAATLAAAKKGWKRRIVCAFQPHTYTRTRDLYREFGRAFFDADVLIVTGVYPAREAPIDGVTGEMIADAASQFGHKSVYYFETLDDLYSGLPGILNPGDMFIAMGAGNIYQIAKRLIEAQ